MEQTPLEQAAEKHSTRMKSPVGSIPLIHKIDAFKAGAAWQKEQYKELLHLSAQIIDAYHIRYPDADQLLVGYTHEQLFKKLLTLRERLQD